MTSLSQNRSGHASPHRRILVPHQHISHTHGWPVECEGSSPRVPAGQRRIGGHGRPVTAPTMTPCPRTDLARRLHTGGYLYPTGTPLTLMGGQLSARDVLPTAVSGRTGRSVPTMIFTSQNRLGLEFPTGSDLYPSGTPPTLMGRLLSAREELSTPLRWCPTKWGYLLSNRFGS